MPHQVETIGDCFMGCGGLMHLGSGGCKELLVTTEEEDRLYATKVVSFAKVLCFPSLSLNILM